MARRQESQADEFYTQLADIERELKHYKKHFKDKVVYCNCDDPRVSNFFHYFSFNFETRQPWAVWDGPEGKQCGDARFHW